MNKHLLIYWKLKNAFYQAWPIRATAARDGEARVLRLFYEDDPVQLTNYTKIDGTIPTVSYFIDKPSEQAVFATATPSAPTRVHWHGGAGIGLLRRLDRPLPAPKCEPTLT